MRTLISKFQTNEKIQEMTTKLTLLIIKLAANFAKNAKVSNYVTNVMKLLFCLEITNVNANFHTN